MEEVSEARLYLSLEKRRSDYYNKRGGENAFL